MNRPRRPDDVLYRPGQIATPLLLATRASDLGLDIAVRQASGQRIDTDEVLELLATEVALTHSARFGLQTTVLRALRAGAGWRQIGAATETTSAQAKAAFLAWVDEQRRCLPDTFTDHDVDHARRLAEEANR